MTTSDWVLMGVFVWIVGEGLLKVGRPSTSPAPLPGGITVPGDTPPPNPGSNPTYDTIHFVDEWGNLIYWDTLLSAYVSLPPKGIMTDGRTLYFDGLNYWACDAKNQCSNVGPQVAV